MGQTLIAAIPFVHPGIAGIALATGLIPIVIHLINRRRFVRMKWAAMTFLLAANQRSVRRIRLERFLLLVARMALVVALGFAIARPYFPATGLLALSASRVHRVLLIDNSMSMNARTGSDTTRFDLAKQHAEKLLASFPRIDSVSLVTLADPAQAVVSQAAYDRRFVREQLASIGVTQRPTDVTGALILTRDILKKAEVAKGNRAVYLISDLPVAAWSGDVGSGPTPASEELRRVGELLTDPQENLTVVRVAADASMTESTPWENLGITDINMESIVSGVNLPARITIAVRNYGNTTAEDVELQIRRDGEIIRQTVLPLIAPLTAASTTITTQFAATGTHLIEARLAPRSSDVLPDDNTRFLSLEVRQSAPILVVDGRPGPTLLAGQAGFLVTALAPRAHQPDAYAFKQRSSAAPPPTQPRLIASTELSGEPLEEYDIVVLCNVSHLTASTWERLALFVERGGGVMIFAGDQVNVTNYNRYGYESGILPGRFSSQPFVAGPERSVGFELASTVHPMVAEFEGKPSRGLFSARVGRYLPIELVPERNADVVLQYSTGTPAMTLSRSPKGGGSVLLCTTTANLDWNNLPAKGDFVSLTHNVVAALAPQHGQYRNLNVGESVREPLTPQEHDMPLRVTHSDMTMLEPELVPDGDGLAVDLEPIVRAGPITLSVGQEQRIFAVNVDQSESDLRAMSTEDFLKAVNLPLRVENVAPSALTIGETKITVARSTEIAPGLVFLVLGLLFLEMWMAMRFGSPRSIPRIDTRGNRTTP